MTVPINESNPKIQCQYVLFKAEFFFKENKKNKNKQNKTNRKQNQRKNNNFFSPHTPTLYPFIVLNVFNMYKMQRKSMKGTYLLKVEGMRGKSSSSHPSSYSPYLDFH